MRKILLTLLFGLSASQLWADIQVQGYLNSAAFENLAADPSCAVPANCPDGRVYWNTTAGEPRIYDGAVWQEMLVGASAVPDPLLLGAGTPADPTYSFSAQSDSGLYDSGTNQLGFATAGVQSATIGPSAMIHYNPAGGSRLQADATEGDAILRLRAMTGTPGLYDSIIEFGDSAGDKVGKILYDHGSNNMQFNVFSNLEMVLADNQLKMVSNGVEGTPAFGFNSQTGTGMWRATNQLNFSLNGEQKIRAGDSLFEWLNNSGAATIRSYSMAAGDANLQTLVEDTTDDGNVYFGRVGSTTIGRVGYDHATDELSLWANSTEHLRVDGIVGHVQILNEVILPVGAVGDPSYTFSANNTDGFYNAAGNPAITNDGFQKFLFGATINRSLQQMQTVDGTAGAPGYSFTGDTNTGLRRSTTNLEYIWNGSAGLRWDGDTAAGVNIMVGSTVGVAVCANGSTNSFGLRDLQRCSSSSRTVKHDIADMPLDYSVDYLHPIQFYYNEGQGPIHKQDGFIAEEVSETHPNLAEYDENGNPVNVNYKNITALLVHEVQKLKQINENLLERIEILEAQ